MEQCLPMVKQILIKYTMIDNAEKLGIISHDIQHMFDAIDKLMDVNFYWGLYVYIFVSEIRIIIHSL